MKLFLALSSLILTSSILCQNYLEFPLEEGTTWVIRQDLFDYDQYGNWTFQSTSYQPIKTYSDTVINDINYQIADRCGSCIEKCFLRQTEGKVYILPDNEQTEYLLYDFTLSIGDQVSVYPEGINVNHTIADTYTSYETGVERRIIELEYGSRWIEGIGNEWGLMATNDPLNLTQSLHCVSTNGDRIYPELIEDTTSCETPNQSINILEFERNAFNFYPNPTEGDFQIEFNESLNPSKLSIQVLNTLGQNLKSHIQILENGMLVELKNASPGIHFILITNEQKTWSKRLIIK